MILVSNQSFNNMAFDVYKKDEEILFNATQVCKVLEYGNPWDAISRHVDEEDLGKHEVLSNGGKQMANFINESGLYALIFGSKKEEAKRFKRWVTSEVLPSIRTSGSYSTAQPNNSKMMQIADEAEGYKKLALLLNNTPSTAAALTGQYVKKEYGVDCGELLARNVSDIQDPLVIPTELGQLLGGMGAREVNLKLKALGLQTRVGKHWHPTETGMAYSQLIDTQKKHSDGTSIQQVKWYKNKTLEVLKNV